MREKVKQAIVDYIKEHDYPPTIREIGDAVYRSPAIAHGYVQELLEAGELETDAAGSPRALRVPEMRRSLTTTELWQLVAEISGCDGRDDYARGWDDACETFLRAIEEVERCASN